ncbi:MotA/TolQ/ExbB proton channel family protein [Pleurocapsales cyanobacterium LEGE 06147]|nr:MotA/TolQ/ExbB proton channel family protein [Pleurocapsales cyanobacterium LEGE 06147]
MKDISFKSLLKHHPHHSRRQELEINLPLVLLIGASIAVAIYILLLPIRTSPIGVLLYDRGFTQPLTIALASIVATITILKYIKLRQEYRALRRIWIAEHIPLNQPNSQEIALLQQRLAKEGSLVAVRCSRILQAYIQSGDRTAAAEFALDDSSFYTSSSESSYSFPRILVWAIPLLGFLGTVFGISQAVGGFTGVLEQAGDVDQIKEGITSVTTGLAVAFDTTLLALCLSILVMIPLVLVERYESHLLLGIDVFINDKLLPRLQTKNKDLSAETINNAVKGAIDEHFPNPETLVEPAHQYAREAAQKLATGFLTEIAKIQDISSQVIEQVANVREIAAKDRQEFMTFFGQQHQANQELIEQIKNTVEEIKARNQSVANGLSDQTREIRQQLEQLTSVLENRVSALEKATSKITDLQQLQHNLNNSLQSLEKAGHLEEVLVGVKDNLARLQPLLQQMNKPRRITFIEQDNGNIPL